MKRLLFIMENLGGGGAERVLPNLLKYLPAERYDSTVLTFFSGGVNVRRLPLHVRYVDRHALYFRGITQFTRWFSPEALYHYYVKQVLPDESFDYVIAYSHGLATKVLAGADAPHKIAWLHGKFRTGHINFPKNFLGRNNMCRILEQVDAFVGCSQQVCISFSEYTGIYKRIHLIHNTNDVEEIQSRAVGENPYPNDIKTPLLVTVGHLQEVKGNDRLLFALGKLKREGYSFHLYILGDGPERKRMESIILEQSLEGVVCLAGYLDNPYPYIKNADVYVCPSRSEGFSTAVSEAIILGCPVISTRVSGAEEILGEHDEFGIVCENSTEGLYMALKQLLQDESLRRHYACQAQIRSSIFDPYKCAGDVERLFDELTEQQ